MRYRVHSPRRNSWSVTSPGGGREWPGLPTQRAAFQLAQSLAGVTSMLAYLAVRRPAQ